MAVAAPAAAEPADASRGQLLYSTHCVECHTTQMHWRAQRQARDWDSLTAQVRRWQGEVRLEWTQQDIDAVARHLNDEFGIAHPESAYRHALLARFPEHGDAILAWFESCVAARRAAYTLFALHSAPALLVWALRQWRGAEADRWTRRTVGDELAAIADPQLRAVLGARWGDYGVPPAQAPFVEHALVTGSFDAGAYYPVGGPARFAQAPIPTIEAAGGEVRLRCDAKRILSDGSRVGGVEYVCGGQLRRDAARTVVSAMGVANTVACLEPGDAAAWQQTVRGLAPGLAYVALYLGFDGDIGAAGASTASHWIYGSEDVGAAWQRPGDEDAPGLYASFPSLKDPAGDGKPTAEVVAMVDAAAFAAWLGAADAHRPPEYLALKARIEERLLAQFLRHFPRLRPLLRFHELATPVTQQRYVRAPQGAMYGVEMSAARLASPALHLRTPLPGLLLAGQDATSPGVQGAFMGGLMAAAAVEPALWSRLRSA